MSYAIALAVFTVTGLTVIRVLIRRDERWLAEQARLDEEARRERES